MQPRLKATPSPPFQFPATVVNRPIRLGYLINRDTPPEDLKSVVGYNSSLWGGRYNLFVPTDGETIREDWWRLLHHHDPDRIICVGDVSTKLIDEIYTKLQPYWMYTWSGKLAEGMRELKFDELQGISVGSLLNKFYDTRGKLDPEKSNCRYVNSGESRYSLYTEFLAGNFADPALLDSYTKILGASEVPSNAQGFSEYLDGIDALLGAVTPLRFGSHNLETSHNLPSFPVPFRLILTDNLVDDLFLCYAMNWPSSSVCLLVPVDDFDTLDNIDLFVAWFRKHQFRMTYLEIWSLSVEWEKLQNIREAIRPKLDERQRNIRLCKCNFNIAVPDVKEELSRRQILISNDQNKLTFPVNSVAFSDKIDRSRNWATEVDLSPAWGSKTGFTPCMFPDLNFLLSGMKERWLFKANDGSKIRIARGDIAVLSNKEMGYSSIQLPTDDQLITTALENATYKVRPDASGRYCQGMVRLAGGLAELAFLQVEKIQDLFHMMSKGKGFDYERILNTVKPGRDPNYRNKLLNILFSLADKRILLRGYQLRCPNCDLDTWYSVESIDEHVQCQGCRSVMQMPVDWPFAFRLNQLFINGIKDAGATTVLLTLLILDNICDKDLIWQSGYKVLRADTEIDLDLIAMCDGVLVFAECKDSFLTSTDKIQELQLQLAQNIEVAKTANADAFFFATLQHPIPPEIEAFLQSYAQAETKLSIRIIHRDELLKGLLNTAHRANVWGELLKGDPLCSGKCIEEDPRGHGKLESYF